MISRNELKLIKSLQSKKHRQKAGKFLVEGGKSVMELLNSSFKTDLLLVTDKFIAKYPQVKNISKARIIETSSEILRKTGTLKTNENALAVVNIPVNDDVVLKNENIILAVENIQDPGNLGTLIRIADWYGIHNILLSDDSADQYNPKVIQSSMGSFIRVRTYYVNLLQFLPTLDLPIIGTFTEGSNIYKNRLPGKAIILLGNESQGISEELASLVSQRITIPRKGFAESLNVAVAAAIVLDNIARTDI